MQEKFSKEFYVIMLITSIAFLYIIFNFLPDTTETIFIGEGSSMEPTLQDEDEVVVNSERKPQAGDILVFKCKTKCKEFPGEIMTKRLAQIDENNCYWLLGDNQEVSYDSRIFGKLCPQDLEVYGVVTDVIRNKK